MTNENQSKLPSLKTPITIAISLFTGFAIGALYNFENRMGEQPTKMKLIVMQDGIVTLDIPLKVDNKGVGLHFNQMLTNVSDIGVNKVKE